MIEMHVCKPLCHDVIHLKKVQASIFYVHVMIAFPAVKPIPSLIEPYAHPPLLHRRRLRSGPQILAFQLGTHHASVTQEHVDIREDQTASINENEHYVLNTMF